MKIHLETMGCQMNRLDSELVVGRLLAAGHEMTDHRDDADVVLFNTCSVRDQAENKVRARLGRENIRRSKPPRSRAARGRKPIVGVLGCMAQRRGEALRTKYPCVDIICSPGRLSDLGDMIARAAADETVTALDPDRKAAREANPDFDALDAGRNPNVRFDPGAPGLTAGRSAQAYLRVMRGCDKFCTYCIVPYVRGPEISRPPDDIVAEARRLVDAGRTEITLLGQTVNSYRHTAAGRRTRFSDLLARVSAVTGLRRLRFVTSHPIDFGDDILHAMRDLDNLCECIHCPAQSGSDSILKAMGRKYTRADYDRLIGRAREILPTASILGDFIVGFPGETEADHAASADLIRRCGYKNSFIFKYSPRPGTAAARRLADDVPADVKRRRNNELLAVQAEVGLQHHRRLVGQTVEVLVEGPSPRADKSRRAPGARPGTADPAHIQLIGRTRGDHIAVFEGPPALAGQYVDVEITGATSLTLFARRPDSVRHPTPRVGVS